MTWPTDEEREAVRAAWHEAYEWQHDQCDHVTYRGGHMHGQSYRMCQIQADRLVDALSPLVAAREAQAAARARDGAADAWDAQRHADAIGDTGTSHVPLGRVYAVRCEWCPKIFVGNNKREAMAEFRRHERAVLDQAHRIERGESS